MCLQHTGVRPYQRWHWAGDDIVHDPIVRAMRRVPVKRGGQYDIDVREFLTFEGNAVIRRTLHQIVDAMDPAEQTLFTSRTAGSFDFRKRKVLEWVAAHTRYRRSRDRFDSWLFPAETVQVRGGDCEDRAFLLASLLEASGISSYCIRVAFGVVIDVTDPDRPEPQDHVWVAYLGESGAWEILEPMALRPPRPPPSPTPTRGARASLQLPRRRRRTKEVVYVPCFVLNREHMWRVRSSIEAANMDFEDYVGSRLLRGDFDASFALRVHEHIFDVALTGMNAMDLDSVKRTNFWVDVDTLTRATTSTSPTSRPAWRGSRNGSRPASCRTSPWRCTRSPTSTPTRSTATWSSGTPTDGYRCTTRPSCRPTAWPMTSRASATCPAARTRAQRRRITGAGT